MNWKQFLKPDWRKVVIFIIFLIIFLPFKSGISIGELYWPAIGLPLPIYAENYFIYFGLIFDLIFWYIVSLFIVWVYDKFKKVKKKK